MLPSCECFSAFRLWTTSRMRRVTQKGSVSRFSSSSSSSRRHRLRQHRIPRHWWDRPSRGRCSRCSGRRWPGSRTRSWSRWRRWPRVRPRCRRWCPGRRLGCRSTHHWLSLICPQPCHCLSAGKSQMGLFGKSIWISVNIQDAKMRKLDSSWASQLAIYILLVTVADNGGSCGVCFPFEWGRFKLEECPMQEFSQQHSLLGSLSVTPYRFMLKRNFLSPGPFDLSGCSSWSDHLVRSNLLECLNFSSTEGIFPWEA